MHSQSHIDNEKSIMSLQSGGVNNSLIMHDAISYMTTRRSSRQFIWSLAFFWSYFLFSIIFIFYSMFYMFVDGLFMLGFCDEKIFDFFLFYENRTQI